MKKTVLDDEIKEIIEGLNSVISKVPIINKNTIIQQKNMLKNILEINSNNKEYELSSEEITMIMNFKTLILASQNLEVIQLEEMRDSYVENAKNWGIKESQTYVKMSLDVFEAFEKAYNNLTTNAVA